MNFSITKVLLAAAGDMSLTERLSYGAQVLVIGICTVFAALAVLWGVIAIFKIFMYDLPQKRAKKKAEAELKAASDASAAQDTSEADEPEVATAGDSDAQLIAVISAAVTAYMSQQSGSALPFRVVSYKRVRGAGGWNGSDETESF